MNDVMTKLCGRVHGRVHKLYIYIYTLPASLHIYPFYNLCLFCQMHLEMFVVGALSCHINLLCLSYSKHTLTWH